MSQDAPRRKLARRFLVAWIIVTSSMLLAIVTGIAKEISHTRESVFDFPAVLSMAVGAPTARYLIGLVIRRSDHHWSWKTAYGGLTVLAVWAAYVGMPGGLGLWLGTLLLGFVPFPTIPAFVIMSVAIWKRFRREVPPITTVIPLAHPITPMNSSSHGGADEQASLGGGVLRDILERGDVIPG
ncbi:MAG TPA: hypothetical protein VM370_08285 [Candidatus Thermoplasmatota archaeon]|nr:hypothetical protein [Candidatus Thermoplasmatota archaeon]